MTVPSHWKHCSGRTTRASSSTRRRRTPEGSISRAHNEQPVDWDAAAYGEGTQRETCAQSGSGSASDTHLSTPYVASHGWPYRSYRCPIEETGPALEDGVGAGPPRAKGWGWGHAKVSKASSKMVHLYPPLIPASYTRLIVQMLYRLHRCMKKKNQPRLSTTF